VGGPPVLPTVSGVPGRFYELIRGGSGADSILGIDGNDRIEGGGGDDWLDGGEGNDVLVGGSGTNWLFGGPGSDSFGAELVAGIQNIDGGPGADRLVVSSFGDTVTVDLVAGTITGGPADNSTLRNVEIVDGRSLASALVVLGDTAANVLMGGSRADVLNGGGGNDVINGGGGADMLRGGSGADRFELRRGETQGDVIADFDGRGPFWGDTLVLSGFGPGASLSNVGDVWTVNYGAGLTESFQLLGVTQLFPGDVIFG
jgi:Ca2+-binding RTX toxin-like protein